MNDIKWCFMDITAASHKPLKWGPCWGMNFHSHPSLAKKFCILSICGKHWSMLYTSCHWFDAPWKLVPLSCNCHCGPFHHNADDERFASSVHSDIKLAGLYWDSTCLQFEEDVYFWVMATLLPTNVFHLLDGPWIHVSTMEESTTLV